jgi:YD repeat-containing protein
MLLRYNNPISIIDPDGNYQVDYIELSKDQTITSQPPS